MKKTILIPTDFQVKSLRLVREALENNPSDEIEIVLAHGIHISSSITDLLFVSKSKLINESLTEDFKTSCDLIKNTYESQLKSLFIDTFIGFNQAAFENFLEGNKIDEIYYYENSKFTSQSKKSFDLTPFVKKSNMKKVAVKWNSTIPAKSKESNQLSEIFFAHS